MAVADEDDRGIGDLLVEQIEFADVLIISKADLIDGESVHEITGILKALNPIAEIIVSKNAEVPLDKVLGTNRFDMEKAIQSPAWIRELNNQHVPETEEYGISSFTFKERLPFHPARLFEFFNGEEWNKVIRSKGYVWIATRNDYGCMWSQAGTSCRLEPAGKWLAAVPESEWPAEDEQALEHFRKQLAGKYGDRRQEFVVIGQNMDAEKLRAKLEECLLTEEELALGIERWPDEIPDPFPKWQFDIDPQKH